MKNAMKKLAVLLALALLFSCMHLTAWAAAAPDYLVQYDGDWEMMLTAPERELSFTSGGNTWTLGEYLKSTPSDTFGGTHTDLFLYKIESVTAPSWLKIDSSEDRTNPENAGKVTADISGLAADETAEVTAKAWYFQRGTNETVSADFTFTVKAIVDTNNNNNSNANIYKIHYTDAAGNKVADDQTGTFTEETYVPLSPQNMKSGYHINPAQGAVDGYPEWLPEWFKYGNPSSVCVSFHFNEFTVICSYTAATTEDKTGNTGNNTTDDTTADSSDSGSSGSSSSGSSGTSSSSASQTVKQGWIYENGIWYYYAGTTRSTLKKGWHHDPQDGFWYYLDLTTGAMFTGWHNINEKWYYFNPYTPQWTWEKHSDGEWYYKGITGSRPLGSMYADETTPDGYTVNANGEREQK
jgi:glucan-binding YG repeat protein